jgi:hypothetical protein
MAVASRSETVKLTRGGGLREAVAFEGTGVEFFQR